MTTTSYVPKSNPNYIPWGNYDYLSEIIASKMFFPVYIQGLSGNGKTAGVIEACARNEREMIRVNLTSQTDETDLIGGFRLVDGETVWHDGPVIVAMKRGAVLLLDEVDLGSEKMMHLQSPLEGGSVFIKKTGELVVPKAGFNIIATANTKGRGSESGQFVGTRFLNEAFLDRFPVLLEQPYPSESVELGILNAFGATLPVFDESFAEKLVHWAANIRQKFDKGESEDVITTRRLLQILTNFAIKKTRLSAIIPCIERFSTETKMAWEAAYKLIDANHSIPWDKNPANPSAKSKKIKFKVQNNPIDSPMNIEDEEGNQTVTGFFKSISSPQRDAAGKVAEFVLKHKQNAPAVANQMNEIRSEKNA